MQPNTRRAAPYHAPRVAANQELAALFDEMAAVLELTGANPFRITSYARAARVLRDLTTDVADIGDAATLKAIEGIGEGTAGKIVEYLGTGRVKAHDDLLKTIPRGLLEVMEIPGLGPKTVKMLWAQGGVTDLESLKQKIATGELETLPRMGAKTIANIRESIAFAARAGDRMRLGEALPLAEGIVEQLRGVDGVQQVEYAGSLRRGRETIGDIDVIAATSRPEALREAFTTLPGVTKVLAAGSTKCSVRLQPGIQVDLRVIDEGCFGAALLYFTGSKPHNVILRERAIARGMRLNEYGLFPAKGDDDTPPQQRGVAPVAAATEQAVYVRLDLPWIPPELREDRGELDAALPELIEVGDIRSDLHCHTVASDGRMTIDQLAEAAKTRGYHTVAVTDHSQSSAQAGGLSPDRLREHLEAVREADGRIAGISVLAGSEVDVHADGSLDYDDDLLAQLDVIVVSPHASLRQEPKVATKRLLAAIRHPLVHVLGHPTGRMINRREGLHPDITALVEAAAEHDTALELNANPMRLDLRDVQVRAAVKAGALIAVNTDAHRPEHFDYLRYGVMTARRGWLTAPRCINTWGKSKLARWLKAKR